jgi:hypothetical protein
MQFDQLLNERQADAGTFKAPSASEPARKIEPLTHAVTLQSKPVEHQPHNRGRSGIF